MARRRRALAAILMGSALAAPTPIAASAADRGGLGLAAGRQPDLVGRVQAAKAATSRLARSDKALLKRTDSAPVRVMIKLDHDALASYAGGVGRFTATSPSVTGRALSRPGPAEQDYESYIAAREAAAVARILRRVPTARIGRSFRVVYGGISAVVPANRVKDVAALDGVVAVQQNAVRQPLTDASPAFIGAPTLYGQLGTTADAGKGVIYGNLDTGVWPEHPSFADLGNLPAPPAPARQCNFGDNPLTPAADPFVCQHKLVGGAAFTEDYDVVFGDDPFAGTARDGGGHGTHTASTSAGNAVASAPVLGVDRGPIHGVAPGAWVMEYKVCGPKGCLDSDAAAAVAQAILDGVEVVNFSITGGTDPLDDAVELAFLDAYAAGVFVSASAGNDGPGAGTVNHLAPWVTTVAASTQAREFSSTLTVTGANGDRATFAGASITQGAGPLPVVLASAPPYADELCTAPAAPGTLTGRIVACRRGGNARLEKGFNVRQGGAAGMILYNPALADVETDSHWLPAVHLADGTALTAFVAAHPGATAQFTAGRAATGQGDVMAAFSSRGPGGPFVKPDVTAPGVQILAGDTPVGLDPAAGPPGEYFQAIAGTSMSSPQVAGSAILLAALHPDWSPGAIKSALMTTARTDVVKQDLTTPADPFDFGAGRIDLTQAGAPPLSFDESASRYAALTGDAVNAVHLNVPSINAPVMPGRLTTTRVATNLTGARQRFTVSATVGAGSAIDVSPRTFVVDPGQSVSITITITSSATPGSQQFGQVVLSFATGRQLHLPVAFVPTQGVVALTQSCSPASIPTGGSSVCQATAANTTFADQVVDLDTLVSSNLRLDGVDGATVVGPGRVRLHGVNLPAARPGVPAVDPGALFGYIPLDAFGVAPVPIGDEEILNFSVPTYSFAGRTYSQIGVDSNGYVVAGGATSADNKCCALPPGPDPAAPNNMLAPFWTDLDGTGAPGVFATVLTDGVDNWMVVEYRVNVFGTNSARVFQVWIGVNGTEDITYAYPAPLGAPGGQRFLVGAENDLGQGDMAATLPTEDLRVASSAPAPGGTASYRVAVRGAQRGDGTVTTEMVASGVPGVTVVRTGLQVTKK